MKITLHRALAEIKMLNKRILSAINEGEYIGYHFGDSAPRGHASVEAFSTRAKGGYQSVNGLINRRNEIKGKLILANATTVLTVAGVEMTIAEAIDQKDFISYKQSLQSELKRQLSLITQRLDNEKADFDRRLEQRLSSDLGAKDRKDFAKEVEQITVDFTRRNAASVIDPIHIRDEIEALELEINGFIVEIDAALSEINALTSIEISE